MQKLLFVCTGNRDRSKTAEAMFSNVKDVEVRSAGTSITATTQLSKKLIDWADRVLVMEDEHQKAVLKLNPDAESKVECLNIPDVFFYNQPELKALLAARLRQYLKS
jgi:predicted protein tyrosine phosphatase